MTPKQLHEQLRPMVGMVLTVDRYGLEAGRLVGVKLAAPELAGVWIGEEAEPRAEVAMEELALFVRHPTADDERRELSRHLVRS